MLRDRPRRVGVGVPVRVDADVTVCSDMTALLRWGLLADWAPRGLKWLCALCAFSLSSPVRVAHAAARGWTIAAIHRARGWRQRLPLLGRAQWGTRDTRALVMQPTQAASVYLTVAPVDRADRPFRLARFSCASSTLADPVFVTEPTSVFGAFTTKDGAPSACARWYA